MGNAVFAICIALIPGAVSQQTAGAGWRNWVPWERYWTFVERELPSVWLSSAQKKTPVVVKRFELPLDSSVEQRALFLRESLKRWGQCPSGAAIYALAHSQGGLDVRYLRRALRYDRVRSLVTVGTPHRGAELAAFAARQRDDQTWLYKLLRWGGYDLKRLSFLDQLVPGFVARYPRAFAEEKDFALAGYVESDCVAERSCSLLLRLSQFLTPASTKGGDGLVSVESQRWGECIERISWDHRAEVLASPVNDSQQRLMLRRVVDFWQRPTHN